MAYKWNPFIRNLDKVDITDLASDIAGTTNQITVTDDGDGTITLSTPQNIHTGASPTFAGLTLSGLTEGSVLFAGASGVISEDNPNLFWNDSTKQLTIKASAQIVSIPAGATPITSTILIDPSEDVASGSSLLEHINGDDNSEVAFLIRNRNPLTSQYSFLSLGGDGGNVGIGNSSNVTALVVSSTGIAVNGSISGVNVTSGADPGHTHTGSSLSGIDISADTNLAVASPITLTDDTIGLDQSSVDHGSLAGLTDDDHTQYLLANGTRALTGNWDVGASYKIASTGFEARSGGDTRLTDSNGVLGVLVKNGGNVGVGPNTTAGYTFEVRYDQNGTTTFSVANTSTGASARSRMYMTCGTGDIATYATSQNYTAVATWQHSGVLAASCTRLILTNYNASGTIQFHTAGFAAANIRGAVNNVGNWGFGLYTSIGGRVEINSPTASYIGLIVQTTDNNTTKNLQEWQTSAGVANSYVMATGEHVLIDSVELYLGTGKDSSLKYDGSNLLINSSEVAPSDIKITCGANKTIELQNVVWDDLRTPINSSIRVSGLQPGEQSYRGGIVYSFSKTSDNTIAFNAQLPHDYVEGSNIEFHVHQIIPTAGAGGGAENVKWTLTYSWANIGSAQPVETSTSATIDVQNDSADTHYLKEVVASIDGTGKTISSMLICSLTRDTAVANNYDDVVYLMEIDFHYQKNTLGSRQETSK